VDASGETNPIDLKSMTQSRLGNPPTCLEQMREPNKVGVKFVVGISRESRRHGTEEQSTYSRWFITWKIARAESDAPGGGNRPRMVNLQLR